MIRKIAQLIIRFRVSVLLAILAGTLFFLYHLKDIRMAFGGGDVIPLNHPYVQLHGKMVQTFGGWHLVAIALRVKEGDIFTETTLGKLYRIQDKVSGMRGIVSYKIISIVSKKFNRINFAVDEYGYPSLTFEKYRDIVKSILDGDKKYLSLYREAILDNEQVYGSLVSTDKKGTVILAGFKWEEDYRYIFETLQQIIQQEKDANTEFYLAGRPIMLGYIDSYLRSILVVFGVAVLVMVVLLYLDFRTIRGILLPLSGGLMSVIWSVGCLSALDFRIDVMSMTIPFLLIALAHGHSVQMMSRYYYEFGQRRDRKAAAVEAIAGLLKPTTTSILTDAVGLGALIFMPFKIIQSMALVGSLGILTILLSTFVYIPVIMSLLPPLKKAKVEREGKWTDRLFERLAGYSLKGSGRRVILALTLVAVMIAITGAVRVKVGELQSGSPDFWADSPYNRAEQVLQGLTGTNLYWIYVEGKRAGELWNPALLEDINSLQRHLEERPEVGYTFSYVDGLKKINAALHEDEPRWETLPTSRPMAAQIMDMLGGSEGYEDTKDLFTKDCHRAAIAVFLKDRQPGTIKDILADTREFLARNQKSDAQFHLPGGLVGIYAAIIEEIGRSQFTSIAIVVVICLVLTMIIFRSLTAGFIIFIPLLIGKSFTLAVMGFGGIGFFIYTLPVVTLGFGLGIDFSLYILARLKEEIAGSGDFIQGYTKALSTSGRAVLFTGITMTGGLITLYLSEMRFQAILGGMLSVVVVANTLVALTFFPVLLSILKPAFLFRKET